MKKIFYSLIFIFLFSSKSIFALEPNIKLTAQDLGYQENSSITSFENIENQWIGVVVETSTDDYIHYDPWAYNVETKKKISLSYVDSVGESHGCNYGQNYTFTNKKAVLNFFHVNDNKLYNIISVAVDNDTFDKYLLITDINTLKQKAILLNACSDEIGFISTDQRTFITELYNCDREFILFEFSDTSTQKIWNLSLEYSEFKDQIQMFIPYPYKNKIYLSNLYSLYSFDANNYQVEKLIDDIDEFSQKDIEKKITSLQTQYFTYNDELYIVYSDFLHYTYYIFEMLYGKIGNTRIWKTDGTKEGTSMEKVISVPDDIIPNFTKSQLFSLNDRLYWIGETTAQKKTPIYEFQNKEMTLMGYIDSIPHHEEVYYKTFFGNVSDFQITSKNRHSSVKWKGKEWMPYYYLIEDFELNLNASLTIGLISFENNQLDFKLIEQPITDTTLFKDKKSASFYYFNVVEFTDENLGLFIIGTIYDAKINKHSDFMKLYKVNDLSKPPINYFVLHGENYNNALNYNLNSLNNEIVFHFTDSSINRDVLWSFRIDVPIPIKNHTFIQKDLFKLYPNPSSQSITLESLEFLNGQMIIVGMDGKVYQNFSFIGHQKNVDISQLSVGMYMTVFVGDGITSTNSFVKTE